MNDSKTNDKPEMSGVRHIRASVLHKLQTASDPLLPEKDNVEIELANVINAPAIQKMMDDFYILTGIGMAIVDLKGTILVATGWQDMCTKFHRVHPETLKNCIESDTELSSGIEPGSFKIYRCKNNLWDMATPIMLGDHHAANLFLGQFIIKGEEPDRDFFRGQAKQYGFDEAAYLAALDRLPRWSRERVTRAMAFYTAFAQQISDLSYGNINLIQTLDRQNELLDRLAQNEKLLRRTTQLLTDTEILSGVGGWKWDITTQTMTWTEGAYRIHDLDPALLPPGSPEHISRSLSCYDAEDRARIEEAFQRCAEKGDSYDLECGFTTTAGRRRRLRTIGQSVRKDGQVIKVFGNIQDITEQKQAQETLRQSLETTQALINATDDCVFLMALDGTILAHNDRTAQRIGHPQEDLKGKNMYAYLPQATARRRQKWVDTVMRTGSPLHKEDKRDDLILSNTVYPLFDEAGKVDRLAVFSRNITNQKKAEAELRQSEQQYRLLADNTIDCIWLLDMDLNFLYINPAIEKMTGWTVKEWIGSNLRDHCDEANFEIMAGVVMEALERLPENKGLGFEAVMRKKNQEPLPVEITGRLLLDASGTPTGLQGVTRDITERRHAEAEREKLREQLFHSQKMESVGRLAGGVAHDFNNMLTIIQGNAELVLDALGPDHPAYDDLKDIESASHRSADLVRKLLAFASKQTIAPIVLDFNETVEGMLKMLGRLIGENIDLTWQPGQQLWPVKIDPAQIDQILANLCVNSRDAITGNGSIVIATHNVIIDKAGHGLPADASPGDFVMLTVADSGCGMDPEILPHLFEPFYTTKGRGKGTGLGLATIHGVVYQNNGFIDVDSTPDQGTTFKIYFPRHHHQATDKTKAAETFPDAPLASGNETLLLVEDEPPILKMGKTFLERLGYRVLIAATPGEAIRLAHDHAGEIHLLITDVIMPEMNGRDLADQLTAAYPGMKRLFMSGYTADVIAGHGVLDPGMHFIQKPFSRTDLAKKVREALG